MHYDVERHVGTNALTRHDFQKISLRLLGTLSYSTYLWHCQGRELDACDFPRSRSEFTMFAIYPVPCVVAVSAASF